MKLSDISTFKREESHAYMACMINDYLSFFQTKGYQLHEPVKIASRIDPTVQFIGSHISVLKPYFMSQTLPEPGYVMTQPCVRTRNLKNYNDDSFLPNWGSMFHSLGTLAKPAHLQDVTAQTYSLLTNVWGLKPDDIKVRIQSIDGDLYETSSKVFSPSSFEIDTKPGQYYRHKVGIDGVWGRNYNIAIREGKTENFSDIGNVIILENKDTKLGIEIALGTSTILKINKGLSHVLDCHPLLGLEKIENPALKIKMEDCIITSMALYHDGLLPSNAHITNRLMKKYMDTLARLLPKTEMSIDTLACILNRYEHREYGHAKPVYAQQMVSYLKKTSKGAPTPTIPTMVAGKSRERC